MYGSNSIQHCFNSPQLSYISNTVPEISGPSGHVVSPGWNHFSGFGVHFDFAMDLHSTLLGLILLSAPTLAVALTSSRCPADHGQALSGTAVRRSTCPLPVDDYTASRTGEWSPWTEEPQCVYPEVEDWDEDVKFCVYTFGTYNLGDGISLLTTPEAAANIAGALWNPEPAWRARKHRRRNTNSEASGEIKYRLEEIPGKGIGAVATQKILRKEVFITDLPSLLIDARLETLSERPIEEFEEERKEIYEKAVANLLGKDRVLRLASSRGDSTVDDIFKTNSFLVAMDEGGNHNGLFPEIAVGGCGFGQH